MSNLKTELVQEANKPQFSDLKTKFFPYSAVEELYALWQKPKLKGASEEGGCLKSVLFNI